MYTDLQKKRRLDQLNQLVSMVNWSQHRTYPNIFDVAWKRVDELHNELYSDMNRRYVNVDWQQLIWAAQDCIYQSGDHPWTTLVDMIDLLNLDIRLVLKAARIGIKFERRTGKSLDAERLLESVGAIERRTL